MRKSRFTEEQIIRVLKERAVGLNTAGVGVGRDIFQSDAPHAMLAAVNAVVHESMTPKEAFELYGSLKAEGVG